LRKEESQKRRVTQEKGALGAWFYIAGILIEMGGKFKEEKTVVRNQCPGE
jgi:hypothetical protein